VHQSPYMARLLHQVLKSCGVGSAATCVEFSYLTKFRMAGIRVGKLLCSPLMPVAADSSCTLPRARRIMNSRHGLQGETCCTCDTREFATFHFIDSRESAVVSLAL
jgi:hypothetical protein